MSGRSLVELIRLVFQNQGPRLHLKTVYKGVRRLGYRSGSGDLNKLIRKRIYEHSSSSPQFIGTPHDEQDLFRAYGVSGSGWWELRQSIGPVDVEDRDRTDDELDDLIRSKRLLIGIVTTGTQERLVRLRRGQARLRQLTIENYRERCAICDIADPALLIASHVVTWAEAPEHRGDLSNVICLCRIHDALFEAGYWSLTDDFRLVKKKPVASIMIRSLLNGMKSFNSPLGFPPAAGFLTRHRERVGL